jgi:hypothetical protein
LTGKKSNVYISIIGNKKLRDRTNQSNGEGSYGQWAVFGVRINMLKGLEALSSTYAPGGGVTDIAIREGKPYIFASNVGFDNQAEKNMRFHSTGFAVAHETIHQLLTMATYNENTKKVDNLVKSGKLMDAASFLSFHTNNVNNLNKDGSLIATSQIRANENVLPNHKAIIIRYIDRFSNK